MDPQAEALIPNETIQPGANATPTGGGADAAATASEAGLEEKLRAAGIEGFSVLPGAQVAEVLVGGADAVSLYVIIGAEEALGE